MNIFHDKVQHRELRSLNGSAHISIYRSHDKLICIISEVVNNHETSITQFATKLATKYAKIFSLSKEDPELTVFQCPDPLEHFVWIEHKSYPYSVDVFELVQFEIRENEFHFPKWKRITKEEAESLIGESLEQESSWKSKRHHEHLLKM